MSTNASRPPGLTLEAFRHQFWLKAAVGIPSAFVFSSIFRYLQTSPTREPVMWAECPTWDVLPFNAWWTWPYLSMFPLIAIAWMAQPNLRETRRFLGAMFSAAATGWFCFLLWPTGSVRPSPEGLPWFYQMMVRADTPLNSMPALHAAFSAVAATALAHGPRAVSRGWQVVIWLWVATIGVATIALRQHTDFDVAVGFALGALVAAGYRWLLARDEEPAVVAEEAEAAARD